jgi:hypothetical protein
MSIKFILTKFIEMAIKTFIIFCFSISVFVWLMSIRYYFATDFDIDFMAIEACYDNGGWWNRDEKICMWVSEKKQ